MRFLIQEGWERPVISTYPTAVLRRDNWDDYGYKTTFTVRVHLSLEDVLELENVKILLRGQASSSTPMPENSFDQLGTEYCSLGQAYSYYEMLHAAGDDVYAPFLGGLQDVVFVPGIKVTFENEPGFETSLLRFDGARRALEDAVTLFEARVAPPPATTLSFTYKFPGLDAAVSFTFGGTTELPNRLAVVIGYNGAGKTRLLANLARLTYADRRRASEPDFVAENGEYVTDRPEFGAIVAVSYSAFDDFTLPSGEGNRSAVRNYTYCGLRQVVNNRHGPTRLKDSSELAAEFHEARAQARQRRPELLIEASRLIFDEPSFRTVVEVPPIDDPGEAWEEAFAGLSAGHKIVLHIVVQLCAFLEPRSLVLIDEPELHLHPPLVAALLRAVGAALTRYNSFGVVATHSPVVLQEVPARSVKVLRRSLDELSVESPDIETYAENVGALTRQVFSLDSSNTDYQGVLRELAEHRTLDEIDALFLNGLSSQGRSLVLSLQRVHHGRTR